MNMKAIMAGLLVLGLACSAVRAVAETDDAKQIRATAEASGFEGRGRARAIETVVVTARKRAESLQDVPISVAVVGADDIDSRRLLNAEDYLRGIPGVNQSSGYQGQAIVIRGIETSPANQSFGPGTTVATYFGEVPTTNSAGLAGGSNIDLKLVDIERVEVLRGPQGTAFGSSSLGGAVRTIPVAPDTRAFGGKATLTYSGTAEAGGDNYGAQGSVNLPLVQDKLAIRAVLYNYEESGFYRNRGASDAAFQTMAAQYGAQGSTYDDEEIGAYNVMGGRIAALLQATDDLRFTLSYIKQQSERDGVPLANSGKFDQSIFAVAPEHLRRGQRAGYSDTDIDIVNALVQYNLGWAELVASYSHVKSEWEQSTPFSSLVQNQPISYHGPGPHQENVGEVRLASQFEGSWNFVAGVYSEDLQDDLTYEYLWQGAPSANPYATSLTPTLLGRYETSRDLEQKAVFGEVSWEFIPSFTVTGGARAYDYERSVRVDADGGFYGASGIHTYGVSDASGTSYRANLSFAVNENAMVYAGWSDGFRLGRPQAGIGACDRDGDGVADGTNIAVASTLDVRSDSVDNYEIGGKFTLFDRRLRVDAAAFRMRWKDVPVRVVAGTVATGCGLSYDANAGEALSEGVELQVTLQLIEPLRIDLGGSYIHARLTEEAPGLGAKKDNRLAGAPEVNVNLGMQYGFELASHDAFLRLDAIHVGPFYGDLLESPKLKGGDYTKLDASGRMEFGSVSLDVFIDNLTNEDAFTFRGTSPSVPDFYGYRLRPRTIGVRLGYTF